MVGWPPALGKQIGLSFEIELNAKLNVTLQRCKFVYTIGRMIFFIQNQLNKSARCILETYTALRPRIF